MNTTKFDLARFKAGEVAENVVVECYYLAELPDGKIAHKYRDKGDDHWGATSDSLEWFEECTTMKPKDEWVVVRKVEIYDSLEIAELDRNDYPNPDDYITVKIVRQ